MRRRKERAGIGIDRAAGGQLAEALVARHLMGHGLPDSQATERIGFAARGDQGIQHAHAQRRQLRKRKPRKIERRSVVGRWSLRLRGRKDDQHRRIL